MLELNEFVFGKIKVREILGAEPELEETKNMLEREINELVENLEELTKQELEKLKTRQEEIEKEINSRPGAMALPQNKIRLFTEYNSRYTKHIENKISVKE